MKLKILLIDSNQSFRMRITAMLRDKGYAVYESGTLARARAIFDEESIDLVCVDGTVAGEPGSAFLEQLEGEGASCGKVFVAHPHSVVPGSVNSEPSGRVDLLLQRPISPEELVYKLDTILKLRMLDAHQTRESLPPEDDVATVPNARVTSAEVSQIALRNRYACKVPSLFSEIGELLVEASQKRESVAELKEAHRIAHMLNGTAGSIGLTDVSSAVHSLECALKEMVRMRRLTSVPASPAYPSFAPEVSPEDRDGDASSTLLATVLVVDDDPDFLDTVSAMGRENLIHVLKAEDGEQALDSLRRNQVDAAIIDIILSNGEDAYAIAKSIRAVPHYQALPLGFISVDDSISQRIAAAHSGASLFLRKPLRSDEFLSAVRRLVPPEQRHRPKILVVDDDPDFLEHMTTLLESEGVEVATLENAVNIVDALSDIRPDLILLDVVMAEVNGLDACRVLRSTEAWRDIPILMLTVYGNRKSLVQCFEAGADDYVEKPIIKDELLARIRLRLDRIQMYRERADTDVLTGLPTRRPFLELLKMRISEGIRFNKPVSLCLLDLDHFKNINDSYGHLAGDRVLAGLGLLLSSRFRTMDVRGRWGGEEFVVAFFGEDAETAEMIVGRVLDEFRKMTFKGDHGESFSVTFSAGIASFPASGKNIEELFRQVDRNLYTAKDNGRNQIVR